MHLGGACQHCGLKYNGKNGTVFQFHHRDPESKAIELGQCDAKMVDLLAEVQKCDLLCANCHKLHHAEEY
jgi:predicted HNH restriction endonuclease